MPSFYFLKMNNHRQGTRTEDDETYETYETYETAYCFQLLNSEQHQQKMSIILRKSDNTTDDGRYILYITCVNVYVRTLRVLNCTYYLL